MVQQWIVAEVKMYQEPKNVNIEGWLTYRSCFAHVYMKCFLFL